MNSESPQESGSFKSNSEKASRLNFNLRHGCAQMPIGNSRLNFGFQYPGSIKKKNSEFMAF